MHCTIDYDISGLHLFKQAQFRSESLNSKIEVYESGSAAQVCLRFRFVRGLFGV